MTKQVSERLDDIERRIEALESPSTLINALDAIDDLAQSPNESGVRYNLARGIVVNRLGLPGSALTALQKARALARQRDVPDLLAMISREISRVHAWRGETSSAALELMRSVIEADAAGSRRDTAAAVAEFGRLNLETGRYEAALAAFDFATSLLDLLASREASRLPVNRREALLALGRHDECLDQMPALIGSLPAEFRRDNFGARLCQARSLAAVGRADEAASAFEDARAWLSDDPQSYERAELALAHGWLIHDRDPEGAVIELEDALDRFVDDDLPRHEFDTRILLARVLAQLGRQVEAEACIVEALRRAEGRQLPAMADWVRAAALELWQPAMIAELSSEDQIGPSGSGRFLVLETLGSGGFGEVQRAIDLDTGGEVAIKRLRAQFASDAGDAGLAMATVKNEVVAASRVPNRYVARTRYLHMESDGAVVLVQDYVGGPTLRQALDDRGLDFGRRMSILASVSRTVAALHKAGLTHRDLKPDNVILRNGTQPVIIDLGLAKLKDATDNVAGLGTRRYAPPEQMRGTELDPRWLGREDVFALGRIIEELAHDDAEGERKGGFFGSRFGRRRTGRLDGPLAAMVQTMTRDDVAERAVDLDRLAELLDQTAAARD